MRPRTSKEKLLLGILLAILFGAANWYGYKWYATKLAALRTTADDLQSAQASTQSALQEIPTWQQRLAWIKDKQPPLGDEGDAKAEVLETVQKGARAHKLEIVEQSLNDVQKTAGGMRVNVSIKVKGAMQDLVEWLAPLQKPDDFYAVTLFSLKADQDQKSFDCTLQIARYFKGGPSS
jgi:hypothetical protein